jgi:hypothetical protein
MPRMILILVLSLLRLKLEVQSDLVTLIDDTAMAARHLAGVEVHNTGNGSEVFLCASDHFLRSVGLGRVDPKNYDVRKHLVFYECFRRLTRKNQRFSLRRTQISNDL